MQISENIRTYGPVILRIITYNYKNIFLVLLLFNLPVVLKLLLMLKNILVFHRFCRLNLSNKIFYCCKRARYYRLNLWYEENNRDTNLEQGTIKQVDNFHIFRWGIYNRKNRHYTGKLRKIQLELIQENKRIQLELKTSGQMKKISQSNTSQINI